MEEVNQEVVDLGIVDLTEGVCFGSSHVGSGYSSCG
jgi:hypothetical protein